MSLRIALLAQECGPGYLGGGIGTYTHALAHGLHELGHDVTIVGRHDGPMREERNGYRVVYAPRRHLPARLRQLGERLEAVAEARSAVRRLGPFDVVEGPDWLAEGLLVRGGALQARHVHGANRTLRLHGGRSAGRAERLAEALETYDLEHADVVTAASRLSTVLPSGESALSRPVVVVPMPLDPAGWHATPLPDAPVISIFGRIEARKGGDVLVRAAALLDDVKPVVRFVGRSLEPAFNAQLHALATELDVRTEFLGGRPASELPALYAASRLVAVPSRFEPYSMVALEALAAGRPAILSDACGAAEALRDNVFTFPQGDVAALAGVLRSCLIDSSGMQEHARTARHHVLAAHSPRAAASAKLAVWEKALR
ncbi:MAG: glycogen synthase [Actinomycetota bacterium]|jgi:glycosyltransferase involved in cell wall biosynthesis|nr:glycogen synthase [Actinomycetota bacterium]